MRANLDMLSELVENDDLEKKFFIFIAFKLKSAGKETKREKTSNNYLPPLLKQRRFLQILFGSVAFSLIISITTLPLFLLFFNIDEVVYYIENYFFYQISILGLLLSPLVIKKLE